MSLSSKQPIGKQQIVRNYLFLLHQEDSLNWHCDYRYIANRKKYSQAGEVGEDKNLIYRLSTNDRRPERGIER